LAVKNLRQNAHLAKAIAAVGWGEILRQLEYKANWFGRTLIRLDRWYPSRKTCSICGWVLESLALDRAGVDLSSVEDAPRPRYQCSPK
jgi:putative transposase